VSDHVYRRSIERAGAAVAVMAALALGGCSNEAGFPAVHDMPAPRAETTMTPDQVKEATDPLINQRDQLQTSVQSVQPAQAAEASAPPTTAPAPVPGAKKKAAVAAKPAPAASTDDATGATAIGAYAKP
jgi:hypothetical protein